MYIMMIEKEISVIVNLIESYGHNIRQLFLSLSLIAPSEAVSLFVVLVTMFRKRLRFVKLLGVALAMHGHVWLSRY